MSSRLGNTLRNARWGFAARLVAVLGPFVVRMLLIQRLGVEYLGLSTFFVSLLQMLNLAELGFSSAVAYGMYGPIARNDERAVAAHLGYLKSVYRAVGVAILAIALLLVPVLGHLVKGAVPADVNITIAYALYVLNTVVGYFLFAHKTTLLSAHQRKDLVDKVTLVVLVAQFGLQALLLVALPNFYVYALVLPLCTAAGSVAIARVADAHYPQFRDSALARVSLSAGERAVMRKRVAGLVLQKACMITRDPLSAVAVSAFVGLESVAVFGNYFMVVSGVLGVLWVFAQAASASVGNAVATESAEKNYTDLRRIMFLYALASMACAGIMIALYQPFMALWVGPDLVAPFDIAVLMTLYFYVRTTGDIRTLYVDATGVWWQLRGRAVAETVGNVVLCVTLVPVAGVRGALLALIASLFVFNFLYGSHLVFKYYFGRALARSYYIDHALYAAAACLVALVTGVAASFVPDGGLLLFIAKALVASVCSVCITAALFVKTNRWADGVLFFRKHIAERGGFL